MPASRTRAGRARAGRARAAHKQARRVSLRRLARPLTKLLLVLLVVLLVIQGWFLVQVIWWKWHDPGPTPLMRAQLERLRQEDPAFELRHRWVAYDSISVHLKRAVIASEDARFTVHEGIDWDAIEKAYEDNRRRGRVVRGGSTITMQLAKNLFLSAERSYLRKLQELVLSYMLEAVLDKRRILEIYLNVAEWGVGVFGAQAAAEHYYRMQAAALGPEQAARLAAMLPRPRHFDLNRSSESLHRRAERVLRWMPHTAIP
jgi:monofunctional biosynthetic peptidoglycan transglycosylase